jgi:hypothetical protein
MRQCLANKIFAYCNDLLFVFDIKIICLMSIKFCDDLFVWSTHLLDYI